MSFNEEIYNLWREAEPSERGDYIPKFASTVPKNPNADVLFFTLNSSLPKRVNQRYRRWMKKIGWIQNENDNTEWRNKFEWKESTLATRYDKKFIELSAKIHDGARAMAGSGIRAAQAAHLYPRFFRRLNWLAEYIGMQRKQDDGLELYDYAHVDLYFWLDSSSQSIRSHVEAAPGFAERQKTIAFRLLEAWRPRTIICPYSSVRQEISCFCRANGDIPDWRPLDNGNGRVQTANVKLRYWQKNVLIIICQNLLGARSNVGVRAHEFKNISQAIADCVSRARDRY